MSNDNHFLYDPDTEEVIDVRKNTSVGRSDSNSLPIKDQSVSSKHARLILKADGLYIEDLDSFNSSYVNGNQLVPGQPVKLEAQDVVQFGDKRFYFSSTEPCKEYLDIPSNIDSFSLGGQTGQAIVHNYDEPILDINKKKKSSSLKNLRLHKDEIEKLGLKLKKLNENIKNRDLIHSNMKDKEKEAGEFASYLESRNYNSEIEVNAIIFSIEEVSQRIEKDKLGIQDKIDVLRNQIEELNEEIESLDNEKDKNIKMMSELNSDIEIIKGRDSVLKEISEMKKTLESLDEKSLISLIKGIEDEIINKEKEYKEAQKKYTDSRFGKKDMFGKKVS